MKTLKLLGLVLMGMTAFAVSSCGSDSDNDNGGGGGGGSLNPPKYESSAALYNVTDANSDYSSIEFTASGNYIITKRIAAKAPNRIAKVESKFHFGFMSHNVGVTRSTSYDNIIYGTYTKNGDTYTLEGFGTIVVNGGGSNAVSLDITTTGGSKVTVGAQQEKQYSSSSKTDMLCRTWNMGKIKLVEKINGQTFIDQTFNDCEDFVRQMLKAEGLEEGSSSYKKAYKEMMEGEPKQVVFTKSGTYMVFYANNTLAVSTWKWIDEAKGEARYSWDYESINSSDMGGKINISFSDSQLVVSEYSEFTESGTTGTVDIQWFLTEAK